MHITVEYTAQIRSAAGLSSERYEVQEGSTARTLLPMIADRHGADLSRFLLREDGSPQTTLLAFIAGRQVHWSQAVPLEDGQTLTLLSPVSGG